MTQSVEALHRFGLKLFAQPDGRVDCRAAIPVFHHWIQTGALGQQLLIDVADYTHLVDGPSVLLVGHDLNLSLDTAEGRLGLQCMQKRPGSGSFIERLTGLTRTLLMAARLLESEPAFDGRLRFVGKRLQFISNDRIIASPGEAAAATLSPPLRSLMAMLYPGQRHDLSSAQSSGDRLRMVLTADDPVPIETLLQRAS